MCTMEQLAACGLYVCVSKCELIPCSSLTVFVARHIGVLVAVAAGWPIGQVVRWRYRDGAIRTHAGRCACRTIGRGNHHQRSIGQL